MDFEGIFFNEEDFEFLTEKIGRGRFGRTSLVKSKKDDKLYASKIILDDTNDIKSQMKFVSTYTLLSQFSHPSIAKFIGINFISFDDPTIYQPVIITEYFKQGSLESILFKERKKGDTNWTPTKKYICMLGISSAMKTIHERGILHGNLIASNILIDENYYPQISHIGLFQLFPEPTIYDNDIFGKPKNISFYISDLEISQKRDVYDFAKIAYDVFIGKKFQHFYLKTQKDFYFPENFPEKIKDLILRCRFEDPDERPSFEEIFNLLSSDFSYSPEKINEKEVNEYLRMIEESSQKTKDCQSQLSKQKEEFEAQINILKNQIKEQKNAQEKMEEKKEFNIFDEETIKNVEKIEKIGYGGGGEVFKVYMKEIYALKEMNVKKAKVENIKQFIGEYEIINFLQHPNIIKTFGIFLSGKEIPPCMLLEYCPINLETAIENKILTNEKIAFIIYQIAEAMKYVHFKNVIHRDLKPTNILIANDGTVKICDFGISKLMTIEEQSMTRGLGSQKFMAPEIINEEEKYDEKIDVYSFGVVIFFILSGGQIPIIKIGDILKGKKAEIPSSFTDFSKKLINECWNFESKDRPSFKEIVDRMFKNNFDLVKMNEMEIKNVKSFVKQHKTKIPLYDD